jgi:hypothetical protein
MNCTTLATRLTEQYHFYERYAEGTDLYHYLGWHGLFLSMCLNVLGLYRCSLGVRADHVSATWIQAQETGYRVFAPTGSSEQNIGMILDPATVSVTCLYPADAATIRALNCIRTLFKH